MGWFSRDKAERKPTRATPRSDTTQVLTGDDRIDAQKVRVLLDTISDLISTVAPGDVLTTIVDRAIRVVGAERGILFLFEDGDTKRMRVEVARDAAGADLPAPIQFSTTVTKKVAGDGEPMCWKVSSHEGAVDLSQSIVDMKLRAVMCVTLRVKERPLGLIYVDSRATHREFSRSDLRFFDALAGALAIAVENANLVRAALEAEGARQQIRIARSIQEGLIPKAPANVPGFELAGWSRPAEEALGDYYDFIPLRDGRWIVAIGDVAGHGVGPAILMSSARALLRASADGAFDLSRALSVMNHRFEDDTGGAIFMSLFVGVIDPQSRTLTYGNAGHTPPLLVRKNGESSDLARTGAALGIDADAEYEVAGPIELATNDVLVLTTDGVLESRRGDEVFGRARLRETIDRCRDASPAEMVTAIQRALSEFTGGKPADDDLTLVVVKSVNA